MAYNEDLPACTTVLTDGTNALAEVKENFRALKEDKIVAAASATAAESCTGNASTATKLETAHAINGVAFDGTADIIITAEANGGNADTATKATSADSATMAESCTGNSATATKLATARTIATTGDVTGMATSFDGSANISIPTTLADSGVTAGSYTSVTVDAKGRVTAGTNPTSLAVSVTGNAATATKLATARTISLAGDATGSTTFDGSGNASITVDVTSADSAVACTGNAATATKLQTARTINGVSFDGSANIEITTANGGTIATTDQVTAAAAHGKQLFTSSGTFVVPTGVTSVKVTCVGGAGGGGGGVVYYTGGTGGTGATGYVDTSVITVTPGQSIAITIGAGGALGERGSASSNTGGTGGTGGTTYFGSLLSAPGGPGGTGGSSDGGTNGFSYAYRRGIFYTNSIGGTGGFFTTTTATAGTAGLCIVEW